MSVTTRGDKPSAADAPLWGGTSGNISKPTTPLIDAGYALQASPGSANWNWISNFLSAGVVHNLIYGIAQWDTNETYVVDSYTNRNGIQFKSRVGANQGNIPENNPTEWHDMRAPLLIDIAASGAHVPNSEFDESIEVDLSGGNISINSFVPGFIGQKIHIYGVGSGLGDIAGGAGLYVNGIFFTENTGGVYLTAISLTEWRTESGVTADYVSGSATVMKNSSGNMQVYSLVNCTYTGATELDGILSYPDSFLSLPIISLSVDRDALSTSVSTFFVHPQYEAPLVSSVTALLRVTTNSVSFLPGDIGNVDVKAEGEY